MRKLTLVFSILLTAVTYANAVTLTLYGNERQCFSGGQWLWDAGHIYYYYGSFAGRVPYNHFLTNAQEVNGIVVDTNNNSPLNATYVGDVITLSCKSTTHGNVAISTNSVTNVCDDNIPSYTLTPSAGSINCP